MRYFCPICAQIYEAKTLDGLCLQISCFGEELREYIAENVETSSVIENLFLLVCDASFSMDEAPFTNNVSKLSMVTRAVQQAVNDLDSRSKPECVLIGIIAFAGRAIFVQDRQGRPFVISVPEIQEQFGDHLGDHLFEYMQDDKLGIDRRYSDFMAPLKLARDVYGAFLSGDLSCLHIDEKINLRMQQIWTSNGMLCVVPNLRVILYSDGEYNPEQPGDLINPFDYLDPSPLITAFVCGESANDETKYGADQMLELANVCPVHRRKGYFLIDSAEKYAVLRGLFRTAAGASGFCPECIKPLVLGESI